MEVSFTITDGTISDKGSVSLPIGGFQSSVLTMEGSPRLGVRLSGMQHVELRVRNNSDSFPVTAFLAPGMHQVQLPEDLFDWPEARDESRSRERPGAVFPEERGDDEPEEPTRS